MSGLAPYRGRWDRAAAIHLLNRAGFGPLPEEVSAAVRAGLPATVRDLMAFEPEGSRFTLPTLPDLIEFPRRELIGLSQTEREMKLREFRRANQEGLEETRGWWIRRMLHSRWPLREKLVLFWHGHFATSANEVRSARLMFNQNAFLRKHCLADFRTLLVGISQDPAMLRYLDNNTNRKERPNENYARELMELFSMGIGNYTEEDVKAAARAFTGWTFAGEDFEFQERNHDTGPKKFLDRTGNFDGTDIIDIILDQPCTARFMATKLLKFFVTDNPASAVVDELADLLRGNGYQFRPALETLFLSEYFYSAPARRTQIKSPAQLVVGSVRLLGVHLNERALAVAMRNLGQDLLYPPNVKGWDGGETWISTQTLLQRYNFAGFLLSGEMPGDAKRFRFRLDRFGRPKHELATWYPKELCDNVTGLVDSLVARLVQAPLDAQARQWLIQQAETARLSDRPVRVAHLIMSMPDYQLC
jgi:hypothetical protein